MDLDTSFLALILQKIDSNPDLKQILSNLPTESLIPAGLVSQKFEDLALYLTSQVIPRAISRPLRYYVGSCLDLIHSGHFNFLRQAKALGGVLVVGIIADSEILRCKGPPVMNQRERFAMAEACKWADEVIDGVEYLADLEILQKVQCDFVVHGDDLAIRKDTGTDACEEVRKAGKLKIVKRTEGISTSEMIGKMLLMNCPDEELNVTKKSNASKFLASVRRLNQFSTNKSPGINDKIVYVDGSFDLLHLGHLQTLKAAKALGDFLIVGVHDDKTVNQRKGKNFPIMNLHERTLNLLALKYVDDVIMGAPWEINQDMVKTLNISVVVKGKIIGKENYDDSRFETPKRLGIFQEILSEVTLTADEIVERIVARKEEYVQRNTRTIANEMQYYENKTYVQEI